MTQSDTAIQNVLNAVSLIVLFAIVLLLYLYKEKVMVLEEEKQAMLLKQLLLEKSMLYWEIMIQIDL